MKTFTQIKSFLFLISMLCVQNFLSAQQMVFKVNAPQDAEGTYTLYRSAFGATDLDEIIETPIVVSDPANPCGGITNDLTGSIAFVDRGACAAPNEDDGNFTQKVRYAEAAGAVAVIICNNNNEPTNPALTGADDVGIKSFLMEKPDCDRIKLALANGTVNGNIVVRGCEPVPPANAVWGADFDSGLNGWTITTEENKGWIWNPDGDCLAGFSPSPCNMNTPTICNGAISINSNKLDEEGICAAPCPSGIISPNIDLSGVDISALTLQFNQAIREFQSNYYVLLSYDNGVSWPDSFLINSDVLSNDAFVYNQLVRVGLCGVDPSISQLRIQFFIEANYYFWGVDDVFLINEAIADPQVNNNFWAVAPALKTPVTQATDFPLLSDIRNNGATESPNTILTARVVDLSNNQLIYSQENDYGDVEPCEQIENVNFLEHYDQPTDVGSYELSYTISSDNNKFTSNDRRASTFFMTENVFGNGLSEAEWGAAYMNRFINGVNPAFIGANVNYWSIGTQYYFPNGSGFDAKEYRFGIDTISSNGTYSATITCRVYKITDLDEDLLNINPAEKILVGRGINPEDEAEEMFVDNTTAGRRRSKFLLQDLDGNPLTLEDNTGYLFVLHVRQFSGTAYFPFLSFNPNSGTNQTLRWSYTEATNLGFAQEGVYRHFDTVVSRGASDTDVEDERPLYTNFFKRKFSEVLLAETNSTEEVLAENALSIYPNPTSDKLFIDMNLDQVSKNVRVELSGIDGKRALVQNFENVSTETLKINANTLTNGIYTAKITTDAGTLTKKVIVSK